MLHQKPYTTYVALTRAVDDYCERHGITRGAFALRVGFAGENAENQISNLLNPNSQNNISHAREEMFLRELDAKGRELYFSMRLKAWDMSLEHQRSNKVCVVEVSLSEMADRAMIEGSEAFAEVKKHTFNSALTKKDVLKIRKEAYDAVVYFQEIVDLSEKRMEEMR